MNLRLVALVAAIIVATYVGAITVYSAFDDAPVRYEPQVVVGPTATATVEPSSTPMPAPTNAPAPVIRAANANPTAAPVVQQQAAVAATQPPPPATATARPFVEIQRTTTPQVQGQTDVPPTATLYVPPTVYVAPTMRPLPTIYVPPRCVSAYMPAGLYNARMSCMGGYDLQFEIAIDLPSALSGIVLVRVTPPNGPAQEDALHLRGYTNRRAYPLEFFSAPNPVPGIYSVQIVVNYSTIIASGTAVLR